VSTRVVAIDWSGRAKRAHRYIWLAEAAGDDLIRLECGRSREAIGQWLITEAENGEELVVGIDFAFSLPAWFLADRELPSAQALWAMTGPLHSLSERWLRDCDPPFWGKPGRCKPQAFAEWRLTELLCQASGWRPRSVFQVGGAGAVGTGSLRGMLLLHELRSAGFSIWPFDDPGLPLAIEIYPRALTGPVLKSRQDCREQYLRSCYPALNDEWTRLAAVSEDAFDAAVSALQMARHVRELKNLPSISDKTLKLEGLIWLPGLFPA
jgi:hypothetical protein